MSPLSIEVLSHPETYRMVLSAMQALNMIEYRRRQREKIYGFARLLAQGRDLDMEVRPDIRWERTGDPAAWHEALAQYQAALTLILAAGVPEAEESEQKVEILSPMLSAAWCLCAGLCIATGEVTPIPVLATSMLHGLAHFSQKAVDALVQTTTLKDTMAEA